MKTRAQTGHRSVEVIQPAAISWMHVTGRNPIRSLRRTVRQFEPGVDMLLDQPAPLERQVQDVQRHIVHLAGLQRRAERIHAAFAKLLVVLDGVFGVIVLHGAAFR